MELKSNLVQDGTISVLTLSGRFDAYEVPIVKTWLENAATVEPTRIVINLAAVNFIDSTGLATFVQSMKRCRQQEGDLHLCNLQQSVRVIFELTRLDKAFEIFADEDEAVKAFLTTPQF